MAAAVRTLTNSLRRLTLPLLRAIGGVALTLAVPVLRVLAGVCFVIAAVALASDAGPVTSGGARQFHATPAMVHWKAVSPATLDNTRMFITTRMRPWIWDAISAPLLLPSFVFFIVLGIVFGFFGRHRRQVEIFVN
jgi:hypothetical protein